MAKAWPGQDMNSHDALLSPKPCFPFPLFSHDADGMPLYCRDLHFLSRWRQNLDDRDGGRVTGGRRGEEGRERWGRERGGVGVKVGEGVKAQY